MTNSPRLNASETMEYSVSHRILNSVVFGILCILVIGGNTLCLVVLKQYHRHLKTPTRLFLTSLTSADLLIGLLYIFPMFIVYSFDDAIPWNVSSNICFGARIAISFSGFLSMMSLLSVNLDRYLAIEYPLKCETIVTARRARIVLACMWAIGLIVSSGAYYVTIKTNVPEKCNTFYDSHTNSIVEFALGTFIGTIAPFTSTILIYARILVIANRHRKMEKYGRIASNVSSSRNRFADRKALNTFLLVTFISCSTLMPSSVFTMCNLIYNGSLSNSVIEFLLQAIVLCNYWVNILIYTCRDRSFRKGAIKLLSR